MGSQKKDKAERDYLQIHLTILTAALSCLRLSSVAICDQHSHENHVDQKHVSDYTQQIPEIIGLHVFEVAEEAHGNI